MNCMIANSFDIYVNVYIINFLGSHLTNATVRGAQIWSLWFLIHNIIIIIICDLASSHWVCIYVCICGWCRPFILMRVLNKFMKFQIKDYLTLYRSFVFLNTHYFYLCESCCVRNNLNILNILQIHQSRRR